MRYSLLLTVGSLWFGLSLIAAGETRFQPAQQFRATTELVEIDVSVLDRRRAPVRDLNAADFEIKEDGVPQQIELFVEVDVRPTATTGIAQPQSDPRLRLEQGRVIAIFMDDQVSLDALGTQNTKKIARTIVDSLGDADLASVVFVNGDAGTPVLTNDRERLRTAVDRFRSSPQPGSSSVLSMTDVIHALSQAPGRRKLLLYVGGGQRFDPSILTASVTPGIFNQDASGSMSQAVGRMQDLFRQAQRTNVNIYTFDVYGLAAPEPDMPDPRRREREFLQVVANESGGRAIINNNSPHTEVGRVLAENSSYYLLGFRSTNTRADGSYRRLEVRTSRRNVDVRARRGYFADRRDEGKK